MDLSNKQKGGCCCCCFAIIITVVLIAFGYSRLHATETGLIYHWWSLSVSRTPYTAGLHYLGVGNYFIHFPNIYQNIQFSTSRDNLLHTRTSDGLPLILGVSFQYTLDPNKLYDLYMNYKLDYDYRLKNVAIHIISDTACNYTAYNFFSDKQSIAVSMYQALSQTVSNHMYMTIHSLQITHVHLPQTFEDALLETITVQQNITKTIKKKENMNVTFETEILAADQTAIQTVTLAEGNAHKILTQNKATSTILHTNVDAEILAYNRIREFMNFTPSELMQYIWFDSMSTQSNSQFIIGFQPSTMITTT